MKILISLLSILFSLNTFSCPSETSCKKIKIETDFIGSIVEISPESDSKCASTSACERVQTYASTSTLDQCQAEILLTAKDGSSKSFISSSRGMNIFLTNRFLKGATEGVPNTYKIRQKTLINDIYSCYPNNPNEYKQVEIKNLIKPWECEPSRTGYTNDAILKASVCNGTPLITDLLDRESTCAKNRAAARNRYNQILRENFDKQMPYILDPENYNISHNYEGDSSFLNGMIRNMTMNNSLVMAEFLVLAHIASQHQSLYREAKADCSEE